MKKPPVVILHGWNLSTKKYKELARVLESIGYKVYLPVFPGFAGNKRIIKPLTLEGYKRYFMNFIKKEKINRPILIGHSFGGRVAILACVFNPEMFSSLILTGVPGFSPVPKLKIYFFWIIAKVGKIIFKLPFLNKFSEIAKKIIYKIAGSTDYCRVEGPLKETFKNIIKKDLRKDLAQINIPTLLIWGSEDKVVPVEIAYKMHKIINSSQLEIINNSDHSLPYKKAQLFSNRVNQFVQKL